MLDKQDYMHVRACTHRPIRNTYCFSTAKIIRERASMLSYTYYVIRTLSVSFKDVTMNNFHLNLNSRVCE
jgi:hypothetical protein